MPRAARAKPRTPQPAAADEGPDTGYRPIIQQRLPEMPGRMSTAYGSAVTMNPRSPMRGQQRNLRSVVDRALSEATRDVEEDEEEGAEPESSTAEPATKNARRSKTTEPARAPSVQPMSDDVEPDGPLKDKAFVAPPVHKDPRIKAPPGSWVAMSPPRRSSRAASQPPESTPDKPRAPFSPTQMTQAEIDHAVSRSFGSLEATTPTLKTIFGRGTRFGSEPPPGSDMDTSRSFANESVVFGDATLLSTPGSAGPGKKGRAAGAKSSLPNVREESPQPPERITPRTRRGMISSIEDRETETVTPGRPETISSDSDEYSDIGDDTFQTEEDVSFVGGSSRISRQPSLPKTGIPAKRPSPQPSNGRPSTAELRALKLEEAEDEPGSIHGIPETPGASRRSTAQPQERRLSRDGERASGLFSRVDPAAVDRQTRQSAQTGLRSRTNAASRPAPAGAEPADALQARARWQNTPEPELNAGERFFEDPSEEVGVQSWLSQELGNAWAATRKASGMVYRMILKPVFVILFLAVLIRAFTHHYGPHDAALGMFTPLLPWNWGKQVLILPDQEAAQFHDVLKRYEEKLEFLSNLKGLDREIITKIETLLPNVIHVERDARNKIVIPQNFWHALRDTIREDDAIMTFTEKGRNVYEIDNDEHWIAIKNRIERDSTLRPANTTQDMDKYMEEFWSKSWENWMRKNNKKVSDSEGAKGNIITRDEFMEAIKKEMAASRSKFDAEFQSLSPKIDKLVGEAVKAATATRPPGGMTKPEIESLVMKFVRRAVSDANLEAISNGKINADHRRQLTERINWFNPSIGAGIDKDKTSPDYKFKKGVHPGDPVARHVRQNYFRPPRAALEPWEGEAECWCGALGTTDRQSGLPRPVELAVLLPREVVPTHLVVEHLPGTASVDPGARPKDIELWVYVENTETRSLVMDFSAAKVAHDKQHDAAWSPVQEGFVKVGAFKYEDVPGHSGVQVFRLADELLEAKALTDTILIRSTSNYGAEDHTCFYRVRLFGHTEEEMKAMFPGKR